MTVDKIINAPTPNEQIDKINELVDSANTNSSNINTINNALSSKENFSNKVTSITNTTSTTLYPSNKAVVDYVAQATSSGETPTGTIISSIVPHSLNLTGYIQADGRSINNSLYPDLFNLGRTLINNFPESITIYDNYKDAYNELGLRTPRNKGTFGPFGNKTNRYITANDDLFYAYDRITKNNNVVKIDFLFGFTTPLTFVKSTYFFGTNKDHQGIVLGFSNTSGLINLYVGSKQNTSSWDCSNGISTGITLEPSTYYIVNITLTTTYVNGSPTTSSISIDIGGQRFNISYTKAYEIPVIDSSAYFTLGGYKIGTASCNCYIHGGSIRIFNDDVIKFNWTPYREYHGSPATALLKQKYYAHGSFWYNDFYNEGSNVSSGVYFPGEIYKINSHKLDSVVRTDDVYILDPFTSSIGNKIIYKKDSNNMYYPCGIVVDYFKNTYTYYCYFYRYDLQERWYAEYTNSSAIKESLPSTLRVPKLDNMYLTQLDSGDVEGGRTLEPGLPPIEGSVHGADGIEFATGPFYDYGSVSGNAGSGNDRIMGFSASGSNQIYGNSGTVRPLSAKMWYWIKT